MLYNQPITPKNNFSKSWWFSYIYGVYSKAFHSIIIDFYQKLGYTKTINENS